MKKTIHILLTLSLILSLFSCTTLPETVSTSDEIDTTEIVYTDSSELGFVMVSVRNKNNLLDMYKIYPEEAVMLPLCPDPLCKHNSESCPFYNINPTMYTIGDTVYYLRKSGGSKLENTICSYDFGTDKFKVLHEVEKGYYIMCFRPYEKYIFFFRVSNHSEGRTKHILRYDMVSGEVITLSDESATSDITFLNCENDRYYFCRDFKEYYSTDADYKNRVDNEKNAPPRNITGNSYFELKSVPGDYHRSLVSIYELTGDGSEPKLIVEGSYMQPIFHNGNIIYSLSEERYVIGYCYMYGSDNPSPVYQYSGGKYRICNADGSNKQILCDISDTTDVIDFGASAFGDVSGVGDYVVLKAMGYDVIEESDEKGRRILESTGDKYISVNIKTGEYKTVTMG